MKHCCASLGTCTSTAAQLSYPTDLFRQHPASDLCLPLADFMLQGSIPLPDLATLLAASTTSIHAMTQALDKAAPTSLQPDAWSHQSDDKLCQVFASRFVARWLSVHSLLQEQAAPPSPSCSLQQLAASQQPSTFKPFPLMPTHGRMHCALMCLYNQPGDLDTEGKQSMMAGAMPPDPDPVLFMRGACCLLATEPHALRCILRTPSKAVSCRKPASLFFTHA